MNKKAYQPKDTGKLTNFHYGTKLDRREEEVLTTDGTKKMRTIKKT